MGRTIETGTDTLTAEVADGVAVITMNRPERRNAMTGAMLDGLATALRDVETAEDVRCIVLTGAGGAFCAGGDVTGTTADHMEASKAFVAKREPEFKGR